MLFLVSQFLEDTNDTKEEAAAPEEVEDVDDLVSGLGVSSSVSLLLKYWKGLHCILCDVLFFSVAAWDDGISHTGYTACVHGSRNTVLG